MSFDIRSDISKKPSEPRPIAGLRSGGGNGTGSYYDDGKVNDILAKLEIENKIKEGAENLLQVCIFMDICKSIYDDGF